MTETEGRPQDQGRKHRKRAAPSEATLTLLARYRTVQREALGRTLDAIEGTESGQLGLDGQTVRKRPALADEARLWDLAIKLANALGAEIDPPPPPDPRAPAGTT